MRITIAILAAVALAAPSAAQTVYAPKGQPGVYTPPHRPHTKLADLKAKHAGKRAWRETIVDDEHLRSDYVLAAPSTKVSPRLHPDTRIWWVVMEGQVRFEIEGQQPFVAARGSMVQAPMQTIYSFEVAGDSPALYFETSPSKTSTLYVSKADAPPIPGLSFMPVRFPRTPGVWLHNNKPHVSFDEVARGLEEGRLKGTVRIVQDDRGTANFIYGYEKQLPPFNPKNLGHYHPECAEYWLIMRGQIRYPIETVGDIVASEGDVVYVPRYTFHAPRWHGEGPSCRLAMNGYPQISHLYEESGGR
jgi:mannose-6-phosphate isomerase-like protein (cupin superfamily)